MGESPLMLATVSVATSPACKQAAWSIMASKPATWSIPWAPLTRYNKCRTGDLFPGALSAVGSRGMGRKKPCLPCPLGCRAPYDWRAMPIALLPMTTSIAPLSHVPRFGRLLALCWACLIVAGPLRAQEVTIRADVAPTGSSVDAALQDSLNLPVRQAAGLQGDQVAAWARIDRDRLSAVLHALGFH